MLRSPMFWVLVKLLLILTVNAQTQVENIFDTNTGVNPTNICETQDVEGSGRGCYECYLCDDSRVRSQRSYKNEFTFKLADTNCKSHPFCCFSQKDSRARSQSICGTSHPEGFPRRVRKSLREVLPGQYPWRTWIYLVTDPRKPICAGVYVDSRSRSIVTPASCLGFYEKDDLRVKFLKRGPAIPVQKVIRHFEFLRDTLENDIAILSLGQDVPSWAEPACLDEAKLRLSSACTTVSADDNYINSIVPRQSSCNKKNQTLGASQLCAITPRDDYEPEIGGGLVCESDDVGNKVKYSLYGIKLSSIDHISIYTNITVFYPWLDEQFDN